MYTYTDSFKSFKYSKFINLTDSLRIFYCEEINSNMESIEKYDEWNYSCYYNMRKNGNDPSVQIYGNVKSLIEC